MLIRLLICFGLGAIPFSVLAMAGSGIDIRKVGSGNPGFNNVLRVSKSRAIWALAGDLGKGVLALVLVWVLFPPALKHDAGRGWIAYVSAHPVLQRALEGWIFGFVAILGHCYSPFLKFKGGKGIATSAGVMLVLYPPYAVIALACFVAARLVGGKRKWPEAGALASLSSWILFALLMLAFEGRVDAVCAAIVAAFLFWRHRQNLRHLFGHKASTGRLRQVPAK
jgi:acyl phosphate:glycerol-3-phosphate acyltransferase